MHTDFAQAAITILTFQIALLVSAKLYQLTCKSDVDSLEYNDSTVLFVITW